MFTIQQIHQASEKVKSGADFSRFIQDLKALGVKKYEKFVSNGLTNYYGKNGFILKDEEKYPLVNTNDESSSEKLQQAIQIHQNGQTDYKTFCLQAAEAGIEKWITDTEEMTVTYLDKAQKTVRVEQIPQP
jgi:uncharacterized protein YbcV (DUF1398 family)